MKTTTRGMHSAVACIGLSVLAGVAVFLLGVGLDHLITLLRLEHSQFVGVVRLLRDGIMACFVLLLVLSLLNAQRHARERAGAEIAVILEINDSVRNALQIIALSFTHPDEIERIRLVKQGAERVQRALERLGRRFIVAGRPEVSGLAITTPEAGAGEQQRESQPVFADSNF
jgi:hypothetical protein